jgi:heme/copper-type cytochrome/quinol oxidase subunit 3
MKKKILLASAALTVIATTLGITTALAVHDHELGLRLATVGWILVTGSVGLFFVGLAYPKE